MDQQGQQNQGQQQGGLHGPTGRRLHIAHRRSPSEMTPLMSKMNLFAQHHSTDLWIVANQCP